MALAAHPGSDRDLKAKFDQLIAAGTNPKVALVAIMRKLIILANALLRPVGDAYGAPHRRGTSVTDQGECRCARVLRTAASLILPG